MFLIKSLTAFLGLILFALSAFCQPKLEFSLKKPKQYEERLLPSEKSATKKFTKVRRFFQNNFTHYNYFFNANLRLNEIIEAAKLQQKDDYTELLPYHPYSLKSTAQDAFLDSILQKCTAGILLHDLRNDWIDNLYLVMGKAYLMKSHFDSAAMTFQFINQSFAPKEKDGFDKLIGSNSENEGNGLTISTKEKSKYLIKQPPSRNEAFVWQVRTLTEDSNYIDASSLIETLRNDPFFPDRLKEELADSRAYLYYKMESWDSAAVYLEKAIPLAPNRTEKARSWYLAGQLYQLANQPLKASNAYKKCTEITLDPVMEVYARLNSIRLNKSSDPNIIGQNVAELISMAKKDKYQDYQDIIYYAAALFEMERNGFDQAKALLKKSIENNTTDAAQRSRSFYLLADIAFIQKKYAEASPNYDSLQTALLAKPAVLLVESRKPGTNEIYMATQTMLLQDSLLKIAALPEDERTKFVKALARKLRKEKGIKEETASEGTGTERKLDPKLDATPSNLFAPATGDWYFYDPNLRANGYVKFKEIWGGRPNVDNWRRSSSISLSATAGNKKPETGLKVETDLVLDPNADEAFDTSDISFDNLYSRLPLSDERKEKAQGKITAAMFQEGIALHQMLEDYPEAIRVFETILKRVDTGAIAEKSLLSLVHCYTKVGDMANANRCRQLLNKLNSNALSDMEKTARADKKNEAERSAADDAAYRKVYDLFIEGNFVAALEEKRLADSALGKSYWKPQLLYIESIYHIRQRDDSTAKKTLGEIETGFATSQLAPRAKKLIDILGRRKEIEDYLTKLNITRLEDEPITMVEPIVSPVVVVKQPEPEVVKDSVVSKKPVVAEEISKTVDVPNIKKPIQDEKIDSGRILALSKPLIDPAVLPTPINTDSLLAELDTAVAEPSVVAELPTAKGDSALIAKSKEIEKPKVAVDSVMVPIVEKATAKKPDELPVKKPDLPKTDSVTQKTTAVVQKPVIDSVATKTDSVDVSKKVDPLETIAKVNPPVADTALATIADKKPYPKPVLPDVTTIKAPTIVKGNDTIRDLQIAKPSTSSPFVIQPEGNFSVAIILEKVDPAYVNEVWYSLNASSLKSRSEKEDIVAEKLKIKESLWLVLLHSKSFSNAAIAAHYIRYLKPLGEGQIFSWLNADKYQYSMISAANIALVKANQNMALYHKVLQETFPGAF